MKIYTILIFISSLSVVLIDIFLKTYLLRRKLFWIYFLLISFIMIIVNGYLTFRPIVLYNEAAFSGIRIFTIPLEDFFFGFSLLGMNLIIWEYLTAKKLTKND